MSKQLRIQYPGALYHVPARGDRREDIVHDDGDRKMILPQEGGRRADHERWHASSPPECSGAASHGWQRPAESSHCHGRTSADYSATAVDGVALRDEECDERLPANQAAEDRKTETAQGGEAMAVNYRPLTLSCTL